MEVHSPPILPPSLPFPTNHVQGLKTSLNLPSNIICQTWKKSGKMVIEAQKNYKRFITTVYSIPMYKIVQTIIMRYMYIVRASLFCMLYGFSYHCWRTVD